MFRQTFCKKLSVLKKIISLSLLNRVLGVLACSRTLRVYVPACSRAWRAWRAYVLTCLVCLRVYVRACYDEVLFSYVFVYLACFFVLFALHFNT